MSFIGKLPNASFITSRVHITMGFTMQQGHDFAWLVTQTLIGLVILMIISLLQVTVPPVAHQIWLTQEHLQSFYEIANFSLQNTSGLGQHNIGP